MAILSRAFSIIIVDSLIEKHSLAEKGDYNEKHMFCLWI